jgi:hypothetical protein
VSGARASARRPSYFRFARASGTRTRSNPQQACLASAAESKSERARARGESADGAPAARLEFTDDSARLRCVLRGGYSRDSTEIGPPADPGWEALNTHESY